MTTTVSERVLVDTNVLVAAFDAGRLGHLRARVVIESDPRALCVSSQSQREFLAVLTRPEHENGYGLAGAAAVMVWNDHTATMEVVDDNAHARVRLQSLIGADRAVGKQVHDANLVAVAVEHGATTIITANRRHFERFADLIAIEDLDPA